jgi:hypothetical protein
MEENIFNSIMLIIFLTFIYKYLNNLINNESI